MTARSSTSSSTRFSTLAPVVAIFLIYLTQLCSGAYYGKLLGKLSELHHGVSGEVYAVDGRTLFVKDFTYDGEGPAAYFYVGNSKSPNGNGFRVRDERGTTNVLKRYRKKDITLTLPDGKSLNNVKWFSVWCDEFSVNFGDVKIPRGFDYPKPQKLAALNGVHGVSSEPIVVVDAQTLLIPGFSYDGEAPDAKFWVGSGPSPSPQGIRVPDENGKEQPLRRYDRKTIVLTLPGDLTIHQLGHFGVWCEAFTVDFGHIQIPQSLNVPPSLKMLGVSPQSKLNCEVLEDKLAFEVRWAVAGDSIVVQLVGKLDAGQYMSFGLSANPERSVMVGGDVVVAWVDKETLQGYAIDYFLDAKSQCSGSRGSCPDTRIQENTGSVRLLNAAMVNGYSIVTYQRPLKASDELDRQISTNGSQAIIWAIGPLNERQEVSFHSDYLKTDRFIEFGRPPAWNCPLPDQDHPKPYVDHDEREPTTQALTATTRRPPRTPAPPASAPKKDAWVIPPIQCDEPEDGVLYAQMGPTGGKHGYPAITGHVGWGISWYINGLLIPEINVVRGKNYTFVTEGGQDASIPARYHPFYITDDPVGGYQHKTPEEKAQVKIFAGVRRTRGTVRPIGVGRLCNWVPDQNQPPADEFSSFGAYQRTLTLECDHGEPGIVEWTPDANTPDTVYYQCFTHRYLGWKINVHDSCDSNVGSASENHEVFVELKSEEPKDLDGSSSIRVPSKVTPTAEFLQQHLHHPSHRDYGLRYHPTTNPGKLSTSYSKQLLTNANNNNYDRLKSSSSSSYYEDPYKLRSTSYIVPNIGLPAHRHEMRLKDAHHDEDPSKQNHLYHHQAGAFYREHSVDGSKASPASSYPGRPDVTDLEQIIQQSSSNQQLSNLVPDNPRPMSHGMKYSFPPAATQILYSRPTHHYANNYHHLYHHPLHHPHHHLHHQPEQRTQLMIIKRPVLMRRPILQNTHTMTSPTVALPSRPVFLERKKAVYRMPASTYIVAPEKMQFPGANHQMSRIMKFDGKQRNKLESKVSDGIPGDITKRVMEPVKPMKPARNTGFDPHSIVIEGGFKPIIKNVEIDQDLSRRNMADGAPQTDTFLTENSDFRSIDNFEPVFIPSPPVPIADPVKKIKKKTRNTKVRLDELDDMEMAADRINVHYLPPGPNSKLDERPTSSTGLLVTYDGKKLKDLNLARSISNIEEHSKSRLSSDILSRTPQFGRFKGELPPPIPGEVRVDDTAVADKEGLPSADLSVPEIPRKNTKLTLVSRSKRSAHEGDRHQEQDHRHHETISASVNSGQTIWTNFGYMLLTGIFYYVI